MKFNIDNLVDRIQHQLTKIIGGLLVLTLIWPGIVFGGNIAVAAPLLATDNDRAPARLSDKLGQARDAAKAEIDYAKTPIQDRPQEAKDKVNDGMNYTPKSPTENQDRARDNGDNIAEKVKNFFGK
ncbi:hypothetical protein [Chamaesiphon sp. VAR_69_metabat_338]|uniref:hypothetical protein n=1 Tax=Chamaesiphon sp. VAR_69_metabat_338 TaxID=2964704 RepID=UPI00286DF9A5|nr:hypothetical protein [Chamaesiphon sp. VAR_69_metabat_338]